MLIGSISLNGQVKLEQFNPDTVSLCFSASHYKKFRTPTYSLSVSARDVSSEYKSEHATYDIYLTLTDTSFYIDPVNYRLGPIESLQDYEFSGNQGAMTIIYGLQDPKELTLRIRNKEIVLE